MADTRSALQARLIKQVPPWVQQYLSYFVGAVFAGAAVAIAWMLHALPAFYAPLVTPHSLGPFSWCIVAAASLALLASLRAIWRMTLAGQEKI